MKNIIFIILLLGVMLLCPLKVRAQIPSSYQESEQLEFATELLSRSQYTDAALTYEDFIRQFPHSALLPRAYIGAGDSHFFLKDTDKALGFYEKYENLFPQGRDKWLALLREGQCLFMDGRTDRAIAKFDSIDPVTIQAAFKQIYYFYLGTALMEKGDLKRAGENFAKVIQQKSSGQYTTLAYLRLANIFDQVGHSQEAAQLYESALQSGDSSEVQAQMALIQGLSYLHAGQYELAAMNFQDIVEHYPNLDIAKDAAVDWFITLLKNNQPDDLIAAYEDLFQNDFDDPANGPIHLLAVTALLDEKKEDEALDILNGLMASPQTTWKVKQEAVLQKAKILTSLGQFGPSLQLINTETSLDKDSPVSLQLLKNQDYIGLHEYDKAWKILTHLPQQGQDKATIDCAQANIRHAQGQDNQAASLFMECFNKSKDESTQETSLFNAFLMYKNLHNVDEAIKTSDLYRANYPQGPHFYDVVLNLAYLYSQDKKYDQAIDLLKTVAASPSSQYQWEAIFQLAYNLQLVDKNTAALKLYGIIIKQSTDPQLILMSLKNSAMMYFQNNSQDKAAKTMEKIVIDFPANDFPNHDYLWLISYWQQKNDPQNMQKIIAALAQRSLEGPELLGLKYFTAEAYRLENNCRDAIPLYKTIIDSKDDFYTELARAGDEKCLVKQGRMTK